MTPHMLRLQIVSSQNYILPETVCPRMLPLIPPSGIGYVLKDKDPSLEADFLDTLKMLPYPKMQQSFHASENPRTSLSLLAIFHRAQILKLRTVNLQDLHHSCSCIY